MNRLTEILYELKNVASNPKTQLQKQLTEGKKVIGCMPYFCPEELIYAAGMIPFGIWGAETQVSEAKRYWPPFICSILQTVLELGIRGDYNDLSAVMIPALCDSLKGMEANWRSAIKSVPVIPVAHAQNRKTEAGILFTASQYQKIRKQLEEISGHPISDADIKSAIDVYNDRRVLMRRFIEAVSLRPGLIKPSMRNAIFKSSYFLSVTEHASKVRELLALIEEVPITPYTGPRVVTSGIIADNSGLLNIFDDLNIDIIDDEVTHESLRFRTDVPVTDDPIVGLAQQVGLIEGCSVLYDLGKNRAIMLIDLVKKSGADGVVLVQTKFCDPEEYDYVPIKRMLDNAAIRNLLVEIDQQTTNVEQIRTKIETFCEIIRTH